MHVLKMAKFAIATVVGCVMNSRQTTNMQSSVQIDDCTVCGTMVGMRSRNLASSS